jgi:hypothetical protein
MTALDRLDVDPQATITFTLLSELLRTREEPDGLSTEAIAASMVSAVGQLEALIRRSQHIIQ